MTAHKGALVSLHTREQRASEMLDLGWNAGDAIADDVAHGMCRDAVETFGEYKRDGRERVFAVKKLVEQSYKQRRIGGISRSFPRAKIHDATRLLPISILLRRDT